MNATIRSARTDDAAAIAEIYRPFCESTAVSFEMSAPSAEQMASRIVAITTQYPWLVLDAGGTIAGYAYASRYRERAAYRWSVETTVYVGDRFRRRGVGRALYTTLFDLLRAQGYFNAYAGIALPNAESVGLHEAVGFTSVGVYRRVGFKLGAWHDVAWYQVSIQDVYASPESPRAIGTLVETRAWNQAVARGLAQYRVEP